MRKQIYRVLHLGNIQACSEEQPGDQLQAHCAHLQGLRELDEVESWCRCTILPKGSGSATCPGLSMQTLAGSALASPRMLNLHRCPGEQR